MTEEATWKKGTQLNAPGRLWEVVTVLYLYDRETGVGEYVTRRYTEGDKLVKELVRTPSARTADSAYYGVVDEWLDNEPRFMSKWQPTEVGE